MPGLGSIGTDPIGTIRDYTSLPPYTRNISSTAREALLNLQTGEAFLVLLQIDHADLNTPIRVTSDAVDTTHNSNTYKAFPFDVQLPESADDQISRIQLRIDNVDRQIVDTIRTISSAPTVTLKVVLASSPDVIEAGPFTFEMVDVQYDAKIVTGQLEYTDFLNMAYPKDRFTPADFLSL